MFDTVVTSIVKPKEVEWVAPDRIEMDLGDGFKTYDLLKGAETVLHNEIEVKLPTSRELYKKAENLWKQLKDIQLEKCMDRPRDIDQFALNKDTVIYLVRGNNEIVDVIDLKTLNRVTNFEELHQQFVIDITTINTAKMIFMESKSGISRIVCYDKNSSVETEKYTPVVILELNHRKSSYIVYTGIYMYDTFTILPTTACDINDDSFCDFLTRFDMKTFLARAKEKSEELYEAYEGFVNNPVEISARELSTLLKKAGYAIKTDNMEQCLEPIENIFDDENNVRIQKFYNDFRFITGENAEDILKLTDFRKTFRYNKMTILDILSILSKEYLSSSDTKVTIGLLSDIVYKLFNTISTDKSQVKMIKSEQQ